MNDVKTKREKNGEKQAYGAMFLIAATLVLLPESAMAADPFYNLYVDLANWVNGSLGKMLVIACGIAGGFLAVMGQLKGTLIAFVLAILLTFIVPFVDTIFTAPLKTKI